jgi:hypothetical protein
MEEHFVSWALGLFDLAAQRALSGGWNRRD